MILDSLRKVVQEVNASSSLEEALKILVNRVRHVMETEVCSIYLYDTSTQRYILMATEGLNQASVGKVSLALDQGLVGYVAARKEPINLDDADSHPRYQYFAETGEERYSSFLGTPIIHQGRVLGVLVVQQVHRRRFDEKEEAFLVTLSAQLSGVIAHAEATGSLNEITLHGYRPPQATFQGISASVGIAIGEAVVITRGENLAHIPIVQCEDIEHELIEFNTALCRVRADLKLVAQQLEERLNREERALFDVYLRMLADNALGGEIVSRIVKHELKARSALSQVVMEHVQAFESMEDAYLRERAVDVHDLGLRVLEALDASEKAGHAREYPKQTILVGEEISASMLGEVPEKKLVGIVSIKGSTTSHVAILARAMGIPVIMGAIDLPVQQTDAHELILDGYRGVVYIDPSKKLRKQYKDIQVEERKLSREYEALKDLPAETLDGYSVPLLVNTGFMTDVLRSIKCGAEGIGLYRSEIPFLLRERFPSEEEQRSSYREQLEPFAPAPVTMRTLDIGGDKALSYFPITEDNPFLGWRGIRISLDHPEIFLLQIRAMLKASEGLDNLQILLPMITTVDEVDRSIVLITEAYRELRDDGWKIVMPKIGAMIEVPATVFQIPEIARRVDFLSVGSNDLTQYTLAVDRNNSRVAPLYKSFHPSVLRSMYHIVQEAHAQKTPVSICGEMAGDPSSAVLLMAMGFDSLSMHAHDLPKVKSVIRSLKIRDVRRMLKKVLELESTADIDNYVLNKLSAMGINPRLLHTRADADA